MRTRALLVTAPGNVELGEIDIPDPGVDDVVVETEMTCVSPGTELRLLNMDFAESPWPFVPGYTLTGKVVARGARADLEIGTRVFCGNSERCSANTMWGGHAAHAVCQANQLVVLPPDFDPVLAPLAKLAAIAHRGTRFSCPREGLRVAVVGLGPIGQLSARVHAALEAEVVGADLRAHRVQLLTEAGVRAICPRPDRLVEAFHSVWTDGADVVVDATGKSAVMPQAVAIARDKAWNDNPRENGPVYVVQGSYPADLPLPYDPVFMREMAVYFPRDMQRYNLDAVLDLLATGRLDARNVVSEVRPPDEAADTYAELQRPDTTLLTVAFDWQR